MMKRWNLLMLLSLALPCLAQKTIVVDKNGRGDFVTVQAALDAVPDFSATETKIFIRNGVYKEKLTLAESKQNVTLIGESAEGTVLTCDDYASKLNAEGVAFGTSGSTSFFINGDDFHAMNITFENSSGPVGQAVAARIGSNRAGFVNCRFRGYQDTLYTFGKSAVQLFLDCYIEGTVDFIFGASTAYFENCEIRSLGHGYLTAASTEQGRKYGYVLHNCRLTAERGVKKVYLGRPWRPYGQTVYIDCMMGKHILPVGWHNWGAEKEKTAFYSESGSVDMDGKAVDVSKRVAWSREINPADYTIDKVLADSVKPDWYKPLLGLHPLAFPGAEGFGRYTTGGRGGKVYHVTTLEDSMKPGTLRYAVNQEGTRTIVFDVSGTIHLKSGLGIVNDNLTIAGQSAPGDGICIADYPIVIHANNVIMRYLRIRLGNDYVKYHEGDGLGAGGHRDIVIDHCSVSWSIDECLSVYGNRNTTVQWCLIDQSLSNAGHSKGAHGYGGIWGGSGATFHHNLMAHHTSRTPRLGPHADTQLDERVDVRNNVFYNWAGLGSYGFEGMKVNMVNNYFKPGPDTDKRPLYIRMRIAAPGCRTTEYCHREVIADGTVKGNKWLPLWHVWGKFYLDGNVNPDYPEMTADNWTYGLLNQVDRKGNDSTFTDVTADTVRLYEPIPYAPVKTETAEAAYERVLKTVGASLHRDSHDRAIIEDVRNRTAKMGIINTPYDNRPADARKGWSPWPELRSDKPQKDSDGDGMPNQWERSRGLNPKDPSDGIQTNSDGYTNLEVYLNSLVEDEVILKNKH